MPTAPQRVSARKTYRHGDLARVLLDRAIALAREAGPDAIVLREVTRRAGVVPNAAYRHFASRAVLFNAVRAAALAALADVMDAQLAALGPERPGPDYARATLRAVGTGYLRFAREETGLFRTAFAVPFDASALADPQQAGRSGFNPFQLLAAALDRLVRAGLMPAERRPQAEYLAWSAVHGLALLSMTGPLRQLGRAARDALGQRLLDMLERGI